MANILNEHIQKLLQVTSTFTYQPGLHMSSKPQKPKSHRCHGVLQDLTYTPPPWEFWTIFVYQLQFPKLHAPIPELLDINVRKKHVAVWVWLGYMSLSPKLSIYISLQTLLPDPPTLSFYSTTGWIR